ncbi:MAG: MarR family transcriptional regulator [Paludibacteraceae bacterium]|nr:MarR family transcriptional regulator [Paludibacteraceae bacterium]
MVMNEKLRLKNQLCFPMYACAKEIVRRYTPLLEPFGLTYTQYITMMVLWEHKTITIKDLGKCLFLDSGTLTPMLKKMERSGWILRTRSKEDERIVVVSITECGEELQDKVAEVPIKMAKCVEFESEDAMQLYTLLNKMMKTF